MIARKAIKQFLNRPLRDSAKLKRWSDKKVDREYRSFNPPKMPKPLRVMQKVGFILGVRHPHYLFFFDPGLGKTLLTLALFRYARLLDKKHRPRMLTLVPNTSNIYQWIDECKLHTPKLLAVGIDQVGEDQRRAAAMTDQPITILTYMGFLSLVCDSVKKRDKNGEPTGVNKWQINKKKLRQFIKQFDFFCLDEATMLRNPHSLISKAVKGLVRYSPWCFGLTGTPFGGDPHDLWSIFRIVDGGETLGKHMGLFRAALFNEKERYFGGVDYVFDKRKKKKLARIIRHNSIRYEESECHDLPPLVEIERKVIFPKETWDYYDKLVTELQDQARAFKLVNSVFHQMRYITAGFLGVKDPEGETVRVKFKQNPKLEAMLEDLAQIDPKRKVGIFYEYNASGDIICEGLKQAKIKHVRLWSGTRQKEKTIRKYLDDPSVRAIVSSSAGAYGGNWQVGNYVMFYEAPSSPILLKQELKRFHRLGQKRRVTVFYYQVKGSIDERIRHAHRQQIDLFKAIVDNKIPLKKLERR